MKDGGFTLTETLAAMLIIGLAFGGLYEATRQMARIQGRVAGQVTAARAQSSAEHALQRWMTNESLVAAMAEGRLQGDGRQLSYRCGSRDCGLFLEASPGGWSMQLVSRDQGAQTTSLGHIENAHLVYDGTDGRYDHWPPSGRLQALKAVSIVQSGGDGDQPVLTARLWIEQTRTCQFDLVSRACRPSPP